MNSENYHSCKSSHHHKSGVGFAAILILVGALLLSSKVGLLSSEWSRVFISWQMLLIVIGVYKLFKMRIISAIVLISIGAFYIVPIIASLPQSFITGLPQNYVGTYWPILLIIGGVLIFLHKKFPSLRKPHKFYGFTHGEEPSSKWENNNGSIFKKSAFQSSDHIILDPEFKGGEVTISFGETKLDLRKTNLPEGISYLDIKVSFGSLVIYVPQHWNIEQHTEVVFGSFDDKRYHSVVESANDRKLIIKGSVSFGSAELRN